MFENRTKVKVQKDRLHRNYEKVFTLFFILTQSDVDQKKKCLRRLQRSL